MKNKIIHMYLKINLRPLPVLENHTNIYWTKNQHHKNKTFNSLRSRADICIREIVVFNSHMNQLFLFFFCFFTCTITKVIIPRSLRETEQKMRFGLVLGRLVILKKKMWDDYEQLLRVFFHVFRGKKMLKFLKKRFSCIKWS